MKRHSWRRHFADRYRTVVRLLIVLIVIFCLRQIIVAQTPKPIRRVLILNDFSSIASPGISILDQAIASGLANSPYQIELYSENLESTLFPDPASQRRIRDWYALKFSDRKPDAIITVGPSSLRYMVESHENSFPNTPIIFCGTTEEMLAPMKLDAQFTGVFGVAQPEGTLLAALKLQPNTRHVIVEGGVGAFDRWGELIAKKAFRSYESKLEFTYLTDLDMPSLLERLKHLPSDSIIYHTAMTEDGAGTHFIDSAQSVPLILGAANAPVFVMDDVDLNSGAVGGYLISWGEDGRAAAAMAVEVLNGKKPQNIPIVRNGNVYLFDWRALRRWGFKESDLPPGSTVLNRELSLWERTKWIWIAALLVILGLIAFASYLQFSRRQLQVAKDAQTELSGMLIDAQEKERSRLALELHDDFSQRLALLALGLENAADALPTDSSSVKRQLDELFNRASELGADVHTVSHRLHSSTLETLGLETGISALCKEFTNSYGIKIDFHAANIPRTVNPDVALCLFRIVQEGLQNLRKHSGVAKAQVNLYMVSDKVRVSVRDEGNGFDSREISKAGLGIRSMAERARLLGGQFKVYSEPGKGTRIEVSVPLHPISDRDGHVHS